MITVKTMTKRHPGYGNEEFTELVVDKGCLAIIETFQIRWFAINATYRVKCSIWSQKKKKTQMLSWGETLKWNIKAYPTPL